MTNNEIKAKVLAQYLGQKMVLLSDLVEKMTGKPSSSVPTPREFTSVSFEDVENAELDGITAKLLLRPLSAIKDEEAIEVGKMWCTVHYPNKDFLSEGERYVESILKGNDWEFMPVAIYQFLQLRGYDLPNYLLGGKTLYEAGLAIYSTIHEGGADDHEKYRGNSGIIPE